MNHQSDFSTLTPNTTAKRKLATAVACVMMVGSLAALSTPATAATSTTYETQSQVKTKLRNLKYARDICKTGIKVLGPWRVLGTVACNPKTTIDAYQKASNGGCRMKTVVTANTNSQYSFDRTSSVRLIPYGCRIWGWGHY